MNLLNVMQESVQMLESVLCDPEGEVVIAGSNADRAVANAALGHLRICMSQLQDLQPICWKIETTTHFRFAVEPDEELDCTPLYDLEMLK